MSDIAWKELDLKVVDATVDGIAKAIETTGDVSRRAQNGNLSTYLKWMVAGLILMTVVAAASIVMK
jgi:NADH-quinone oxidoreductase subunit L